MVDRSTDKYVTLTSHSSHTALHSFHTALHSSHTALHSFLPPPDAVGVGEAANFAAFGFIPAMLVTTLGALSVIVRWVWLRVSLCAHIILVWQLIDSPAVPSWRHTSLTSGLTSTASWGWCWPVWAQLSSSSMPQKRQVLTHSKRLETTLSTQVSLLRWSSTIPPVANPHPSLQSS